MRVRLTGDYFDGRKLHKKGAVVDVDEAKVKYDAEKFAAKKKSTRLFVPVEAPAPKPKAKSKGDDIA